LRNHPSDFFSLSENLGLAEHDFVPEGRSKSLSVPQIFVVETEPRHEQATARRMLMPTSETPGIPVEKFGSDDIRPDFGWNEWFLATARRSH
jgi:hypothetical protein